MNDELANWRKIFGKLTVKFVLLIRRSIHASSCLWGNKMRVRYTDEYTDVAWSSCLGANN